MACLRLKRYLSENSPEAIIVSLKRQKLSIESTDDEEVKAVLTLAGTVKSKNESVAEHITKVEKASAIKHLGHRNLKSRAVNVKGKVKRDLSLASKANRYKIVCSARGVQDDAIPDGEECAKAETTVSEKCRVYDLVLESHDESTLHNPSQGQSGTSDTTGTPLNEGAYVYDLYYLQDLAGVDLTQKLVNIQPYTPNKEVLVYGNSSDDSDNADDDDDSNDEGNFRNDYPDEDDNYEKDFAYGDEFCEGIAIDEEFGAFSIAEDYIDTDSDCENSAPKRVPLLPGKMSLRQQIAQIVSDDDIFSNPKYGNAFQ